ncbi:TIGR03086 family protein [Streptomyces sp. N2-109]|uniref:TIGR03086 family protein n=1 Tax=Streptomyces gossypii TaxID=2883101 RepID=A0ABT2K3L2_9ACTN|nr:maleylpyruvate isomerase family mycothiol-dependent enzyme [Streptomyces gossypii]MCT2594765.1 TIGR03086 family protein [Streptomyces gossypii]
MNTATDPRPLLARATGQFASLVATVEPSRLDTPTPCSEFDIRALIGHVTGNTLAYALFAEGGSVEDEPGGIAKAPGGEWTAAYTAAGERLVAAGQGLDDNALDRMVNLGFATMPLRGALSAIVMEISAHTWDLHQALGGGHELDPELAVFSLAYARETLPPGRRGAPVPFEPVRPAPEGADAYGRLAAWLGREVPVDG